MGNCGGAEQLKGKRRRKSGSVGLARIAGMPSEPASERLEPRSQTGSPQQPQCSPRCSSPAQVTKAKIDELDYIKIKHFCASKDTISRMKGNLQNRGKYL